PDAERVLTCGGTPNSADSVEPIHGEAIVWRIDTNQATQIQKLTRKPTDNDGKTVFRGHDELILFGAFSPEENGRYVVTTSVDDTACIWDSENGGAPLYTLGRESSTQYHTADVVSAAFVPNEINQVVTVGKDGRAILWDWNSKKSHVLKPDGNPLQGVFFSKNGHYFLTTSSGTKARVWDRRVAMSHMSDSSDLSTSVSPQIAVLEHSGPIIAGGVHPEDSNRFLTLSSVGTARTSDAATSTQPSARTVANHGVQVKDWNLKPVDDEWMPVYKAASTALAQRKVNSKSQTLEKISRDDLIENVLQSSPKLQPTQSEDFRLERRLRWNRCEADRAEVEGDWHAAAWHLGQLIELGYPSSELFIRRSEAIQTSKKAE
ncbi:MAG: WD40 repeat domain-containing protein, partial [Pirellula staleyi]